LSVVIYLILGGLAMAVIGTAGGRVFRRISMTSRRPAQAPAVSVGGQLDFSLTSQSGLIIILEDI
jgi:hypothetical protein